MEKELIIKCDIPRPAVWFSRHPPTHAQLEEICGRGYHISDLERGLTLGARNIENEDNLYLVLADLVGLAQVSGARALFGVFTAPVQEYLVPTVEPSLGIPCYAAWNITRPVEGGKPVFEHRRFCRVGTLDIG